jgi:predicted metalloprotease with PDZ domain
MFHRLIRFHLTIAVIAAIAGCGSQQSVIAPAIPDSPETPMALADHARSPLEYTVHLNDRADDLFKVSLSVGDLGAENAIYQFASTAPGTYQVMDIGRFVRHFTALDAEGDTIATEHISTNQWRIADPERVSRIEYALAETWDTPVEEHHVYMMCGTSIEDDHVQINGQAVFGYPTGMQKRALRIKLEHPEEWLVGTALDTDDSGFYLADDYDHVVDSPILLGRLTKAAFFNDTATTEIYTYSKTDKVKSGMILDAVRDILVSAGEFLGELPVERYTFLFHFEDVSMGAWEHSYSSTYTYAEDDFEEGIKQSIPNTVAHEFFHIITPLNIHSEIVEDFNYVEPVASEHLWLYEGTTEWASNIMQLRSGLITLDEFLADISQKLAVDDRHDKDYSLSKLSLTSYSDEGQRQYGNIYHRGAIVGTLLDLKLLQLSDGTRGLREVLLELSERYGPDRPFDEESFIDRFVEMTYPEIADFFAKYVRGTESLPIAAEFARLGIGYQQELRTGEMVPTMGLHIGLSGDRLVIMGATDQTKECGLQAGDLMVAFNEEEITLENAQELFQKANALEPGIDYTLTVSRGGEAKDVTCQKYLKEEVKEHHFTVVEDAPVEQLAARKVWMENL